MAVVTPTITTADPHMYREQMELIASFADGVHLDFADGVFAPTELLAIADGWRRDDLVTHIHVMYKDPLPHVQDLIALKSDLVVLHAESKNLRSTLEQLQKVGVRTGVAILPDTSVEDLHALDMNDLFDHVLVFGGHLGYQGGTADLSQLDKVRLVKKLYPDVEISWDGGANKGNVMQLAEAGIDVINVGGGIKNADDPKKAYDTLVSLIS